MPCDDFQMRFAHFSQDIFKSISMYFNKQTRTEHSNDNNKKLRINGYICEDIGIKSRKWKEKKKRPTEPYWKSKSRFWGGGLIGQESNIPGKDLCPLQSYSTRQYRNQYLHAGKAATKKHLKTKHIRMRAVKPAVKRSSLLLLIRKLANKSHNFNP